MSRLMIITYEMRPSAAPHDYARLADGLNSLGATPLFLSTWAIRGTRSPEDILRAICPYLDQSADHVLVVEAGGHAELNIGRRLSSV